MATTDNELNDLIINDISQEEYDNLVATGQVQEGQIYATDGTGSGGGSTTGGLESVAHDSSLEGAGTTASPLKVASTVIAQINNKADGAVVETLSSVVSENTTKLNTLRNDTDSLGDQVSGIEEKIPSSASATNQLATKADLPIGFDATVVAELPATGERGIIYLVPKDGEAPDVHDEYIWIDSEQKFEFIGSTAVDLRDYATKEDLSTVLPDQTDNAGKFLTTDGTTASWSDKPLVNNTTQITNLAIGRSTKVSTFTYGTAVGYKCSVTGEHFGTACAFGMGQIANAAGATQIGVCSTYISTVSNNDPDTLKVSNRNGNFEMMSADGTIPAERMSSTAGTTGQVLTKTDDGMAWQDAAKGGASLPILMAVWSDHVIDDMSWLRADTFSWHSGDVYKAAYEHLTGEFKTEQKKYYAWSGLELALTFYTEREMPLAGDIVYTTGLTEDEWTEYGVLVSDYDGSGYLYISSGDLDVARSESKDIVRASGILSDIIGNITISYYLAEDGHKICLPDQESNIVALYEATGVAWYFILDTENKQFKLPRTKYGFTGLRDSVGGYVAPGLPNITGSVGYTVGVNTSATGAFTKDTSVNSPWWQGSTNVQRASVFHLDASHSSPIYGNSDTVQSPATQMYLYFYVGNFEQSAVEQTAGLNTEMFNDLNAHKVIDFQIPTSANGYTWYRKYADGWVEQGGIATTNGGNATKITLPIEMLDRSYIPLIQGRTGSDGYSNAQWQIMPVSTTASPITTTSFFAQASITGYNLGFCWEVKGMAK